MDDVGQGFFAGFVVVSLRQLPKCISVFFWKVSLRMQVFQLLRQFFESNSCFEECRNWILELCESWQLNLRKVLEYGCFNMKDTADDSGSR